MLTCLWVYVLGISCPPFFGWGGYAAEGVLVTCTYDYLKDVSIVRSSVVVERPLRDWKVLGSNMPWP